MRKLALLSFFIFACISVQAQYFAVSNNLIFDAMGALSAGIEVPLTKHRSWELYGSMRPWRRGEVTVNKHYFVQTQYRIWPCQVMNGFFWGPYLHAAEFNIGDKGFPLTLIETMRQNRYEGWLVGGGVGIGYEYALAKHWNLGAEIGAGYTYIKYKKNGCERCGRLWEDASYNYWGISRLGLNIIYIF